MINVTAYVDGKVHVSERVDPEWVAIGSTALVWVDISGPTAEEGRLLSEVFHFHELSIEDALSTRHHPKIESYGGYLYFILHGIDFNPSAHRFATHDVDFFLGPRYLVTVHDGKHRSVSYVRDLCGKSGHVIEEGTAALAHRIIDAMIDNYRPEVDELGAQLDEIERVVFERPDRELMRNILALKSDVASLRTVTLPQRDVIARLSRREFPIISESMAYRFRDVHDQLVRITDEAMYFQDRISGLLDAHLSGVSNSLNQVMKVLTLMSTVFMPLTVITGVYGMNVRLPQFPGGEGAQFWWVVGSMALSTALMVWFFRSRRWL
ncbi:MAG TPA: magnesium/cobalt transporter CorA [Polyangiales bacterium]|nr:magnesium/cobalt transporter CorA [Polyangiales bacterium]